MVWLAVILVAVASVASGAIILFNGKVPGTGYYSVVEGTPARVIGSLLLLSTPLALASHWQVLRTMADSGHRVRIGEGYSVLAFCLPVIGCLLISVVVGVATAKPVTTGAAPDRPSLGSVGRVATPLTPCGSVEIDGAAFPARSTRGHLEPGSRVIVTGFDTSYLFVEESGLTPPTQTHGTGNTDIRTA